MACAIVFIAYSLAGAAGVWFLQRILSPAFAGVASTLGVPWLAAGIGVSGLVLFGYRAWPGVFAGSCITWGLLQGDPWITVLIGAAGESLSIVLIAWALNSWGYRISLERYQDLLVLVGAAAVGRLVTSAIDVVAIISAVWVNRPSAAAVLAAAGLSRGTDLISADAALFAFAFRWWANTVAGVVLVVPLLSFFLAPGSRRRAGALVELILWALGSVAWLVAALRVPDAALRLPLLAGALMLVVWAAVRLGVTVASAGTLTFSIAATIGFGLQLGVFAGVGGREGIEVQWGFIGLLTGTGLFLIALLSGREHARRQLAASAQRYRHLFVANPSPMWALDLASGRILVVNDAAVRAYGYPEEAFLRMNSRDLGAGRETQADISEDGRVTVETHRTAQGREFEVEAWRVPLHLSGIPVCMCFVEVVDERNDLRLAVLNAADLERRRLGEQVRESLGPTLNQLAASVEEVVETVKGGATVSAIRLASIERDTAAATALCAQLTRGASPMQFSAGNLIDALSRIPDVLAVRGGPEVSVSVRSFAPVALSLERCEHVYRIAQDAVRAALLHPGVRHVHVAVDARESTLEVSVEDDGSPSESPHHTDASRITPFAVRAAAAGASLNVGAYRGGNRVHIECRQTVDTARPGGNLESAAVLPAKPNAATSETVAVAGPALKRPNVMGDWINGLLLLCTYVATGAATLRLLQHIDSQHVTVVPWVALPWVANGVAVVGLLLGGARLAPAVFLGSVALWGGLAHDPWITVLSDAVGETLGTLLTVHLLWHWGYRRAFDRFTDLAALAAAAALGRLVPSVFDVVGVRIAFALTPHTLAPTLVAALSTASDRILGLPRQELEFLLRWWCNGFAGIVLVAPAVMPMCRQLFSTLRNRWKEAAVFAIAIGLGTLLNAVGPSSTWRLPLLALSTGVVAWSAIRFGVASASMATLVLSLGGTIGYGLGVGPLARADAAEGVEALWGFIGLLAVTGLFLTTLVANYEMNLRQLQELKARFEALFNAFPRPQFVYREAGGRISMANAEAVCKYGYTHAQLLGMAISDLGATPEPTGSQAAPPGSVRSGTHRNSSGETFDVELSSTRVDLSGDAECLCCAVDVTERNQLRRRLLETSDLERRRLAHDLHDGLGQSLTGLRLGITSLRQAIERGGERAASAVEFVAVAVRDAQQTCERILQGLSPLDATAGDLLAALRNLPRQFPPESQAHLNVEIKDAAAVSLSLPMREHLYQLAREGVNNALKHAKAERITIRLEVTPALITLIVSDDGVGFDPKTRRSKGLGLQSIALRATAVRGRLAITRRPSGGMAIVCRCAQTAA